jgi:hypothetical protein
LIAVSTDAQRLTGYEVAERLIISKLQSSTTSTQLSAVRSGLGNPSSSAEAIASAVNRLNSLLLFPSNVTVFAVLRTIVQDAASRREGLAKCRTVLEGSLNNHEGTLSVALLHTGFESTIDRVVPSIANFATKFSLD